MFTSDNGPHREGGHDPVVVPEPVRRPHQLQLGRRLAVGEVQIFSASDDTRPVVHVTASYALPDKL